MGDDDGTSVHGRVFASDGSATSGAFQINTYTTEDQGRPRVAVEPDGDFLVVWHRSDPGGPNDSIEGRRYDSSGVAIGDQFQIPEYTTNVTRPEIVLADDGRFLVVWLGDTMGSADTTRNVHRAFSGRIGDSHGISISG